MNNNKLKYINKNKSGVAMDTRFKRRFRYAIMNDDQHKSTS